MFPFSSWSLIFKIFFFTDLFSIVSFLTFYSLFNLQTVSFWEMHNPWEIQIIWYRKTFNPMKEISKEMSNCLKVIPNRLTHKRIYVFTDGLSKWGAPLFLPGSNNQQWRFKKKKENLWITFFSKPVVEVASFHGWFKGVRFAGSPLNLCARGLLYFLKWDLGSSVIHTSQVIISSKMLLKTKKERTKGGGSVTGLPGGVE